MSFLFINKGEKKKIPSKIIMPSSDKYMYCLYSILFDHKTASNFVLKKIKIGSNDFVLQ